MARPKKIPDPGWIKTADRLPSISGEYFICAQLRGSGRQPFRAIAWYSVEFGWSGGAYCPLTVIYWRQLPPMPEMEQ